MKKAYLIGGDYDLTAMAMATNSRPKTIEMPPRPKLTAIGDAGKEPAPEVVDSLVYKYQFTTDGGCAIYEISDD